MRKQITEYTSPLDALVALTKQLYGYEIKYQTDSADFFVQYQQGETDDDEERFDWASNYRHYLALRQELEINLRNVVQ
ncbi:antitoxin TumA [Pseudanabaena yagii]|uniref:Phage protein n=1 Tax=Pseudanabaena yagii GIHE-NHR1 TaxID=2722753 RepID=A0ABX1LY03_9CYAN|nr:hypothetical protein [Pseudanabaena yagii]NMF59850.1 hypothetical protein [Pseudanabaena yagii GIHE-NHR1]